MEARRGVGLIVSWRAGRTAGADGRGCLPIWAEPRPQSKLAGGAAQVGKPAREISNERVRTAMRFDFAGRGAILGALGAEGSTEALMQP